MGKATDTAVPDMQPMQLDWLGKGELRLVNGRSYRWQPLDTWHTEWGFEDENGRVVIEFKQNTWSGGGSFVVNDNSLKAAELNLLANLGWYKSINHAQEMASLFIIIVVVVVVT